LGLAQARGVVGKMNLLFTLYFDAQAKGIDVSQVLARLLSIQLITPFNPNMTILKKIQIKNKS
jgi:hypothetical protein